MTVLEVGPVVVAGEALIDLIPGDGDGVHALLGGGPYNVARTVARLGVPAVFLGRLSTDAFGSRLAAALAADGVQLGDVGRASEPTTLAVAEIDASGAAHYRFHTLGTAAAGLEPGAAVAALPPAAFALHVGTLGLVLEPLAAALEALVAAADPQTVVMVDPNCRPDAIEQPTAYRARVERVAARADVVKVSEEDLAYVVPGSSPVQGARALLALGAAVVLVTRAALGALVVTAGEVHEVLAPPVEVVDTVGAGDAFGGGFLAWWRRRDLGREQLHDLALVREATAFACTVGALTCARAGADPPRWPQVAAVLAEG